MPKQVFVKPVLNLTQRQWRKLMARVFEREERASGQYSKYIGNEPRRQPIAPEGFEESLAENKMLQADQAGMGRPPIDPRVQALPGHRMGGSLPAQETTGLGATSVQNPTSLMNVMNPTGLEYPTDVSRRWKGGIEQSEDIAAAVAQARNPALRARFIDDQETLQQAAETVLRGPTPRKRGSLKERRGIRSTLANPGALLPPKMHGAVEKGGHLPTAAEMMTFRPPETRKYSRLMRQTDEGQKPLDMPWASAARMAYKHPDTFTPYKGGIPPADVLKLRERGGSKFERRVYRPVEKEVERSGKIVDYEAKEQEKLAKKAVKEQARQEKQVGTAVGRVEARAATPVNRDQLFKEALLLDTVWKNYIGGKRTLTGRAWVEYMSTEAGRGKGVRKDMDVRDYFQTVALKWLHEPEKMAKRYPREVRSLEAIFSEVEKEHGPIFQK